MNYEFRFLHSSNRILFRVIDFSLYIGSIIIGIGPAIIALEFFSRNDVTSDFELIIAILIAAPFGLLFYQAGIWILRKLFEHQLTIAALDNSTFELKFEDTDFVINSTDIKNVKWDRNRSFRAGISCAIVSFTAHGERYLFRSNSKKKNEEEIREFFALLERFSGQKGKTTGF